MLRKSLLAIGIALLLSSPALSDIVDVTVDSSVSGSGVLQVTCGLATPGCMPGGPGGSPPPTLAVSYSFGPSTGASGGQAVLPPPFNGFAFSDAFVTVTSTAQTLGIGLLGFHSTGGFFRAFFAEASAAVSVGFDLTEESILGLNTGGGIFSFRSGELLDAHGNIILPDLFNSPGSTLLAPGMYQLDLSAQGNGVTTYLSQVGFGTDLEVGVGASFTPAVPEPRDSVMAAIFASMFVGCTVFRRRGSA